MSRQPMLTSKRAFVLINLLFGPIVPLSYIASAQRWPAQLGKLWGTLPDAARTPYTANMFLAAAGYLAFSWYFFRHCDEDSRYVGRFGQRFINISYLAILIPSLVWMPLSLHALATGGDWMLVIRVVLWLVAGGSTALAVALFRVKQSPAAAPARGALLAARIGIVPFWIQTFALDAVVWPQYFVIH